MVTIAETPNHLQSAIAIVIYDIRIRYVLAWEHCRTRIRLNVPEEPQNDGGEVYQLYSGFGTTPGTVGTPSTGTPAGTDTPACTPAGSVGTALYTDLEIPVRQSNDISHAISRMTACTGEDGNKVNYTLNLDGIGVHKNKYSNI
eukprot:SAG31_NODE_20616_length_569_cov_1.197872_1_plen_144_part_00